MVDSQRLNEARQVLSPSDIDRMVAFLGDQAFRLSHREPGTANNPDHIQDLRPDITQFVAYWHHLTETFIDIFKQPAETLRAEFQEVRPQSRHRADAASLRRNVREGRIGLDSNIKKWVPRSEYIWGTVDVSSLDTPENAHVVLVLELYKDARTSLLAALRSEERSLHLELQHQSEYESGAESTKTRRLQQLVRRNQRERSALAVLTDFHQSSPWDSFQSSPNRNTNRTRFDARYQAVAKLEDDLDQLFVVGRHSERRQRITELGNRRPWEIYEYWTVAKTCALLEELNFAPDDKTGFPSLEHVSGAEYGLRHGAKLTYVHRGSGLAILLTVQNDQNEGQRTDLQLDFVGGICGEVVPLVLDAKCKNYVEGSGHPQLQDDLENSARRYVANNNGTAFLLHPSSLRAWPVKSSRPVPFLNVRRDIPLRHGIERLHPDEDRALRRILTAWFIRHGVFWICLSCGQNHREGVALLRNSAKTYPNPNFNERHPIMPSYGSYGWVCQNHECGIGTVLTRCVICKRLVVKTFPTLRAINLDNRQWLDHVEVYAKDSQKRAGLRDCVACGGTL